uniref:DUF6598 domain-containing protein n=2 Tax=Leersia perrieri TaxID=77586 RepID=A0A0D9X3V3_9ORYZ
MPSNQMADEGSEDGVGSAAGEGLIAAIKRKRDLIEDEDSSSSSSANRSVDMEEKSDYCSAGAEEVTRSEMEEDVDEQHIMQILKEAEPTWAEKALRVLNIVRRHQISEYDPKEDDIVYTRYCGHNIALFDLDKESTIGPGPPIHSLTSSQYWWLDDSVNVIAIKVAESDVGYPIRIYGTVIARDHQDFRCVTRNILKKLIHRRITLTGPYRALASKDSMTFEFNLKILDDGDVGKDFSKEASLAVNILEGLSDFTGKVIAWTTGNKDNEIVLHDSRVADSPAKLGENGSVELTRHMVAVPLDEELVLNIVLFSGDHEYEYFEFVLGHHDEEVTFSCKQGCYEVQVKVIWTAVLRRHKHKMWESIGRCRLLL